MPEGPEVKNMGQYLNNFFKDNIIKSVKILKGRYINKDPPCGFHYFTEKLPLKSISCRTKGKFIYIMLENNIYIFNSLGMSGFWTSDKLKHSNVEFVTKKGTIYFTDQRNFGTLKFIFTQKELELKLLTIGPDLLNESLNFEDFYKRITLKRNQNKMIAKVLMDQKTISGIGNYLRSEILWHTKMSPFTLVSKLNRNKIKELFEICRKVIWSFYNIRISLKKKIINKSEMHKYNFFNIYSQEYDKLGNKVLKEKIDKRTVHYSNIQI